MSSEREQAIANLFTTELQFRLASAVRLATTSNRQPLDLPTEWTHGAQRVRYDEIALRSDQADYAAWGLHRSATCLMAVAMKDAIRVAEPNPKTSTKPKVVAAYQISRLIRNAFAHAPCTPRWSIDDDCQAKTFSIEDVISLDTTELHGKPLEDKHYGGPLAVLKLCRFVRFDILGDEQRTRTGVSAPNRIIYQQGDLILEKADELPSDAVLVEHARTSDGHIDLGGGYKVRLTGE